MPDTDIDDEICTVKVLREGGGGMRTCLVAGAVCLLVSGCVTTPQFETLSGVTPKTIVDVIECELIEAREKIRNANKRLDKKKQPTLDEWTAVADLTLQVDEDASLAPAFAHTDVVSKSLTRAFDWGVKFNTQATRIYTETVTFKIADLKTCRRPATRLSLNGNLGLDETIAMAFGTIDQDDVGIGHPGDPVTKSTRRAREPFVGFSEKGYALSRNGKGRREEKGKKENASAPRSSSWWSSPSARRDRRGACPISGDRASCSRWSAATRTSSGSPLPGAPMPRGKAATRI